MILSIGYRVNSKRGVMFRKWASVILKNHLSKGYSINEKRCLSCQENLVSLNNEVKRINDELDDLKLLNTPEEVFKEKLLYEKNALNVQLEYFSKIKAVQPTNINQKWALLKISNGDDVFDRSGREVNPTITNWETPIFYLTDKIVHVDTVAPVFTSMTLTGTAYGTDSYTVQPGYTATPEFDIEYVVTDNYSGEYAYAAEDDTFMIYGNIRLFLSKPSVNHLSSFKIGLSFFKSSFSKFSTFFSRTPPTLLIP